MKRMIAVLFFIACLLLLSGCGSEEALEPPELPDHEQTEPQETQLRAGDISHPISICLDTASYLFERLDRLWDADGGYLWGTNLHAPIVIADSLTRYAVANMPDVEGEIFRRHGDVYVGQIPEDVHIANNMVYWGGRHWGMVTWGAVEVSDLDYTVFLILHKTFHAQQPDIFEGWSFPAPNEHMDGLDARINVRLELNALLYALRTTGEDQLAAVQDALSIRAERHRLNEGVAEGESSIEILEGTAVYTDAMLGFDNLHDRLTFIEDFIDSMATETMRGFGYYTGALYALLLDEFGVDWRSGLSWECDLTAMLKEAIGFTEATPFSEIDVERYGYSELRPAEEAWIAENERVIQRAQDALSGPLLLIYALGEFNYFDDEAEIEVLYLQEFELYASDAFDYGDEDIHLLDHFERTVFYGNFTYTTYFGKLELTGGHLMLWSVMLRHGIPAHDIEVDGNLVIGPNWTLTLNEGYRLREVDGGHFGIIKD